jgi:DNA-binding transcriptional ArsR family regulator
VLELAFSAHDLAHTRFAFSPLWEVVASVRVLKSPADHALHLPWLHEVRPRLEASRLDYRLLADLVPVPTKYIPDFVAPPPSTPVPDVRSELAVLRATPAQTVRTDLDRMRVRHSPLVAELYANPGAGLERLAEIIERFWQIALDPYWPRIQALLEGEILYRARRMAEGGAFRLFNDLHPSVSWRFDTLYVEHKHFAQKGSLDGRGLVLVPSVFIWPRVFSVTQDPWQPTLLYPPRGLATLWEQGSSTPDGLSAVIGRSRARLLSELESPASTTELARRTGMSAGGVSQHLTALRGAGLVTAHRTGRSVLYARTNAAESLLAAATP